MYSVLYFVLIIGSNLLASQWIIHLPLNLSTPAGVFVFAPLFSLRDRIQYDRGLKWTLVLIFCSGLFSWILGAMVGLELLSRIAIASVVAFLCSEFLDTVIYFAIQESFVKRALVSNIVSSFIDSLIFITLAFGYDLSLISGQWIIKVCISTIIIPLIKPSREERSTSDYQIEKKL